MMIIGLVMIKSDSRQHIEQKIKRLAVTAGKGLVTINLADHKENGLSYLTQHYTTASRFNDNDVLLLLNPVCENVAYWIRECGGELWFGQPSAKVVMQPKTDRFVWHTDPACKGRAFISIEDAFAKYELKDYKNTEQLSFSQQITDNRRYKKRRSSIANSKV